MDNLTKEQKLAQQVIGTYPGLDLAHPSSWILYSNDHSQVRKWFTLVCHSQITYGVAADTYDNLITAAPNNSPEGLAYLTFLIEGPFSQWRKQIHLKSLDDKFYLLVTGLDTIPANVLYNFCIASRFPIEYKSVLPVWTRLKEVGIPEALAYMLSMCVLGPKIRDEFTDMMPSGDDPLLWPILQLPPNGGHLWLDTCSNWANIIDGTPKYLSVPFKGYPEASRPCNMIWGSSVKLRNVELRRTTVKDIVDMFSPSTALSPIVPSELPAMPLVELDLEEVDEDAFDDEDFNEFGYDEVDEL